jgi:hypothetical protein
MRRLAGLAGEIGSEREELGRGKDWLGIKKKYLPFNMARKFARSLKLATQKDWQLYCKSNSLPSGIPRDPRRVYEKRRLGWFSRLVG